jgi:hypothetical protein
LVRPIPRDVSSHRTAKQEPETPMVNSCCAISAKAFAIKNVTDKLLRTHR